jgi:glycosyltransferase involved in cell wall biosynthesis
MNYFVNKINIDNLDAISLFNKILYAPKTIYSFEAKRKLKKLLRDTKPDIVHIHHIKRLISPSILPSIKNFGLPVVCTLHDYHSICPNYRLYSKGKICEACKGNRYYNAVFKRCVRNSLPLSLLACVEQYIHSMLKIFENNVDMFIAPSNFLRQKMIENGMNPERIIHISNFVFLDNYSTEQEFFNYIVFVGRLVKEKGLLILVKAMKRLTNVKLLIIGEGEDRKELERLVAKEEIDNVEFKGYVPLDEIKTVIGNAMFVVVPSLCYDISPMVIYESLAMGKPVIGADIGGIPELIDNGVNGLLCKPGDANDLIDKITFFLNHKDKIFEMGKNARERTVKYYNAEIHYEKISEVYKKLITKI